jgi:trigger factor
MQTEGEYSLLVAVEHLDKWKRQLRIGVAEADVVKKAGELLDEVARDAEMPGFRKGKVPRAMLERRFGERVRAEALESLVRSAYVDAVKESGLRPICDPLVEGLEAGPTDGRHVFTATFDVRPEIEVKDYQGLEFTERIPIVTNEDVDRGIEELREEHAELAQVARPAGRGDFVIIDYERLGDGGKPVPESKVESFPCELGSGDLPPELASALEGVRPGDERTVAITYAEDHRVKSLAGTTVPFLVRVVDVREKRLPVLSDEWAKNVARAETLLDLRVKVRNLLEAQARSFGRRRLEEEIIRDLLARNPFDLPASLVEERLRRTYEAVLERREAARSGEAAAADGGEAPESTGAMPEEFVRAYRPVVERQLKAGLLLGAIADKHGTSVSAEDVAARVARIADARGKDSRALLEDLKGTEALGDIEDDIWLEKVHDLLVSLSQVKTEYVDFSKERASEEAGTGGQERSART